MARRPIVKPRRQMEAPVLEKVMGITSRGGSGISFNSASGDVAFIASGTIVLYKPITNQQIAHIIGTTPLSCISFSSDGKLLAVGEGPARQPAITIYNYTPPKPAVAKTFKAHKHGIQHVAFSPSGELLVSIGFEHDKGLIIWNWKKSEKLLANKVNTLVTDIAFSPDDTYFVTSGKSQLKIWNYEPQIASHYLDLSEMAEKNFLSVEIAGNYILALTSDGSLCVFNKETMVKWVDLQVSEAFYLSINASIVACACGEGVIRWFEISTLDHKQTLPRQPPLGQANINTQNKAGISDTGNQHYADTIACLLFADLGYVFALYSDRSIFIWDIRAPRIKVYRSFMYHASGITDLWCINNDLYATSGSDRTVRVWITPGQKSEAIPRNLYNKDLCQLIYTSATFDHFKAGYERDSDDIMVKCIQAEGTRLAWGDSSGILRVIEVMQLQKEFECQAHNAEITALSFNSHFLSTGSRDRCVHVFNDQFEHLGSSMDHSGRVNDVLLYNVGAVHHVVSCGADKTIVYREILQSGKKRIKRTSNSQLKNSQAHALAINQERGNLISAEDKMIRYWAIKNQKETRKTLTESVEPGAHNINCKIALNSSEQLLAVSNQDRTVRVYNFESGKLYFDLNVGEVVTGLMFTHDNKRLICGTQDGCIYVWRMSDKLVNATRLEREPSAPAINAPVRVPDPTESDDLDIGGLIPDWAKARYPEESPGREEKVDPGEIDADILSPPASSPHEFALSMSRRPVAQAMPDSPTEEYTMDSSEEEEVKIPSQRPNNISPQDLMKRHMRLNSLTSSFLAKKSPEQEKPKPKPKAAEQDDIQNIVAKATKEISAMGLMKTKSLPTDPEPSKPVKKQPAKVSAVRNEIPEIPKIAQTPLLNKQITPNSSPRPATKPVQQAYIGTDSSIDEDIPHTDDSCEIVEDIGDSSESEIEDDFERDDSPKITVKPVANSKKPVTNSKIPSPPQAKRQPAPVSQKSSTMFSSLPKPKTQREFASWFSQLRENLTDTLQFFQQIDAKDRNFTQSLNTSARDILEINKSLAKLGKIFGTESPKTYEQDILESFADKLYKEVSNKFKRNNP